MPFCPTPCQREQWDREGIVVDDGGPGPGDPCPICLQNPCKKQIMEYEDVEDFKRSRERLRESFREWRFWSGE